jgi:hypothetical protein
LLAFTANLQVDLIGMESPVERTFWGGPCGSKGTGSEEKFAAGFFGLISDQAVHSLIAQQECARLARNVIIE